MNYFLKNIKINKLKFILYFVSFVKIYVSLTLLINTKNNRLLEWMCIVVLWRIREKIDLVRNYEGNLSFGFYRTVGRSNVLHVEIQTLLISFKLCWQAGIRKVICNLDFLCAVQLVLIYWKLSRLYEERL